MKSLAIFVVLLSMMVVEAKSQTTYEFELAGYNNVPVVRTPATGTITATVDGDSLSISGTFRDLRGSYWSAFIHYGEEGERGNRLIRLNVELNDERTSGEFKKEANIFQLRPAIREALKEGNLYIVVSSNRNQDGEIRGQIPRM